MATRNQVYDHPLYLVRRAAALNFPVTAASASAGKFIAFTNMRIKSINLMVNVAGTGTAGYDVKNGTTSFTNFSVLTSAAGYTPAQYATDINLTSGGYIDFVTNGDGATQKASAMIEYELTPFANITV